MALQTDGCIHLRAAQPEDASQVAPLMIEAGNGLYEFLFEGFGPAGALVQIIERTVSADEGPYGFHHCLIAERDGQFAGFVNAFPAELIRGQDRGSIPQERWDHIAPMNEAMHWDSFFLNNIGVLPGERGNGIGRALLEGVFAMARELGIQEVTLLVWEGNDRARKLYERHGFAIVRTAILAPHSLLPETRVLLMRCELTKD